MNRDVPDVEIANEPCNLIGNILTYKTNDKMLEITVSRLSVSGSCTMIHLPNLSSQTVMKRTCFAHEGKRLSGRLAYMRKDM